MKKILGILLFISSISLANAGFIGHDLDADYLWPDNGTVYDDMSVQQIGSGVEWTFNNTLLDADDNSITLSKSAGFGFSSDTFNGWSFTDYNGTIDDIIDVTIDSFTGISSFDISRVTFDIDSIFLNFAGLVGEEGFFVKVGVAFATTTNPDANVPEPSIILLFSFGLFGLIFYRRKKQY